MKLEIQVASTLDIETLLNLYLLVYGSTYPLEIGTNREAMAKAIASPDCLWLVTRDLETQAIVGSSIIEMDRLNRIGKLLGVVVHPAYRSQDVAYKMISTGTARLLSDDAPLNSIYCTTRTLSIGPQIMVLKDGFLPLGIFPNAHRLKDYETLTLLAKFHPGVLKKRAPLPPVPEKLIPIVNVLNSALKISEPVQAAAPIDVVTDNEPKDFELILAPHYVKNRFLNTFTDAYDRFYPFHVPNLLIASTDREVEIYAYLSKADGYCAIVALTTPIHRLAGTTRSLLNQLKDYGVSYLEILIGLEHTASLQTLLDAQFLPSAIYPAMQETHGKFHDFAVMSRTLEPLNFRGMSVDQHFKPYVDQYIHLWKQMHLDTLKVFDVHY